MLRKPILIICILCLQNSRATTIKTVHLNKEERLGTEHQNFEESIVQLENIIYNKKTKPYDLYNAYYKKYLIYKNLFDYPRALSNLKFAEEAGLKSPYKEKVLSQVRMERLFLHFDLLQFEKVKEIIPTISKKDLHYLDRTTQAFYLSVLGTMEMRSENYSEAEKFLNEAEILLLHNNPKHLPLIYRKKLGLNRTLKNHDQVVENFNKGLLNALQYKTPIYVIAMYNDIEHYYLEVGDNENARLARLKVDSISDVEDAVHRSANLQLIETELFNKRKHSDSKTELYVRICLVVFIIVILIFLYYYFKTTKSKHEFTEYEFSKMRTELQTVTQELSKSEESKLNLSNYNLTERQNEIILLVKQGLTNKEIGAQLFISENTVKYHLKIIYDTLNICNRSQL